MPDPAAMDDAEIMRELAWRLNRGIGALILALESGAGQDVLDAASRDRIIALIARTGLPTTAPGMNIDQVVAAMASDKKVADAKLRFILPDRIGHVVIRDEVPATMVRTALESLL